MHKAGKAAGEGPTLKVGDKVIGGRQKDKAEPMGGTYLLVDRESGDVVYTGRSNDLDRREREHGAKGSKLKDYDFVVDRRTDDYKQQRGREEIIYMEHPGARLNKIRAISLNNGQRDI